jgi:16S rRNA pseudouridine516 synthase
MNKPAGLLTATEDRRQPTVLDLLPPQARRQGVFPVGRLDKDTTGLLLLTDDGDFAHRVISPKSEIKKVYRAQVDGSRHGRTSTPSRRGWSWATAPNASRQSLK